MYFSHTVLNNIQQLSFSFELLALNESASASFHKKQNKTEWIDTLASSSTLTAANYQATGEWNCFDLAVLGGIDRAGKLCKIEEKWDDLVSPAPLLSDGAAEMYLHGNARALRLSSGTVCFRDIKVS